MEEKTRSGLEETIKLVTSWLPQGRFSLRDDLLKKDEWTAEEKKAMAEILSIAHLMAAGNQAALERIGPVEYTEERARQVNELPLDNQERAKLIHELKAKPAAGARKLYIADCHFYHGSLNQQMDKRGFSSEEEMNQAMIDHWNKAVGPKDEVYILGDLSIERWDKTEAILQQLRGKKYLILGNHDLYTRDKDFKDQYFGWIKPYAEIKDNGRKVILCHYPIFCYNGQYRTKEDGSHPAYMLYGHVHNTQDEILVNRFIRETRHTRTRSRYQKDLSPIPCQMINAFCMFADYEPKTLDEWIGIDEKRREKIQEPVEDRIIDILHEKEGDNDGKTE